VQRHTGALGPVHLGDQIVTVLAQRGTFRGDVDGVEKLLQDGSSSLSRLAI
jgi:hypothetical protein